MSSVHFKVNCGYARVAIRQFSEVGKGKKYSNLNTVERNKKFETLFHPVATYGVDKHILKVMIIENALLITTANRLMVCSKSGRIVTKSKNTCECFPQKIGRNCLR